MDRTFVSRRESRQASCSRSRLHVSRVPWIPGPVSRYGAGFSRTTMALGRPHKGMEVGSLPLQRRLESKGGDWIPASAGMTVVGVDAEGLGLTCSPSFRRYISTTVRGLSNASLAPPEGQGGCQTAPTGHRQANDALQPRQGTPQDDNWSQDCRGSSQRRGEGFSAATTRERVSRCLPQAWGCRNGLEVVPYALLEAAITSTSSRTAPAEYSRAAFSPGVRSNSMTCSTPPAPSLTGTPTKRPSIPYSPSR